MGAWDSPAYCDISAFVQVARGLRNLDESAVLQTWSLDREAAYRQLSVKEPAHTFAILQTPSGLTL